MSFILKAIFTGLESLLALMTLSGVPLIIFLLLWKHHFSIDNFSFSQWMMIAPAWSEDLRILGIWPPRGIMFVLLKILLHTVKVVIGEPIRRKNLPHNSHYMTACVKENWQFFVCYFFGKLVILGYGDETSDLSLLVAPSISFIADFSCWSTLCCLHLLHFCVLVRVVFSTTMACVCCYLPLADHIHQWWGQQPPLGWELSSKKQ